MWLELGGENMNEMVSLLETHEKLAGWAQFMGAMLALLATYLTAFMPLRHRKKQLQKQPIACLNTATRS
jgi:hypothetical protein